jgi:prepilin-type N-terminal cleavage/methylation domain-containing protein
MASRGMTIVELVIVVALLAVLSTLALVAAQPMANRYHQRDAVELASQLVTEAQGRARSTGRCHRVVVYASGALAAAATPGTALALEVRPTADCETAPASVTWSLLEQTALPTGVTAQNIDDATWTWTEFRPNGRVRRNGAVGIGALVISAPDLADHLVMTVNQGVTCLTDLAAPGACP